MSLVPSLMDGIFPSSNLSLVPPVDEVIKILQCSPANASVFEDTLNEAFYHSKEV